jgi:uncharacterized protein
MKPLAGLGVRIGRVALTGLRSTIPLAHRETAIKAEQKGEIEMSENPEMSGMDVTSDDRLWAALAYVFTPLIPIILLLMEDKKNRPFIRAHNAQALAWGVVFYVVVAITSAFLVGLCIWPLGLILELYWGYRAYQGGYIKIPMITDFVKNQGWA